MDTDLLKKLFCLICLLGAFSSCSDDDENPFQGTDNSIITFQLEHEGVIYPGLLTTNELEVQAAANIVLEGATAVYTLSEKASISPDPAAIKDWDDEHEFIVTSYNGEKKVYKYSVAREAVASGGDVTLSTQAEVDAFLATGISIINGMLVIGKEEAESDDDYITDLSGLDRVERIYYNLEINPTFTGSDFSGLKNLQQVGGLTLNNILQNLTEISFPKLVHVNHQVLSITNSYVETIDFPVLESCSDLSINASVAQSINFGNLKEINGNFSLTAPVLISYDFDNLKEIRGNLTFVGGTGSEIEELSFPLLERIDGEFTLNSTAAWGNISVLNLPKLAYTGAITFTNVTLQELEFPALVSGGNISIQYLNRSTVQSLRFPVLKEVNTLTIKPNTQLFTITEISLPALCKVAAALTIISFNMSRLEIPFLEYVGGDLKLDSPQVGELSFPSLKEVAGTLALPGTVDDNTALTNLDGFATLEKLSGFTCSYYVKLVDFSGLATAFKNSNPTTWRVLYCGYNPTIDDMANERYTKQ